MTQDDWIALGIVIVCLLLSAFFSASETALTASSRAAMARLEKHGNRRAQIVNQLLASRERLLGAILFSSNAVKIAASSLATGVLLSWFGDIGVIYAIVIMTIVVVVFSEIIPKTAAFNAPDRGALLVARPMQFVVRLVGPMLMGIEAFARWVLRVFRMRIGENLPILSPEERRGTVDRIRQQRGVERIDRGSVLDLRELEVSDVMIHRTEMATINIDQPPADIVRTMLATPHTRLPLWRGHPENIVGTLRSKDVLRTLQAEGGDASKIDIAAIMTRPWFVPDTTPLAEQLKAFRRRKTRFALVVDEYGQVMGLVTLDDIVGEIIGDLSDEHDVDIPGVRTQLDGSVHIDGSVPIRDLNRAMDWSLPDEQATTIAGLVIHEARSIPEVGQSFTFHGFRFRVVKKSRNRITALRVTPLGRRYRPLKAG
jgi:Mg2+/Co2+ transporter CorB